MKLSFATLLLVLLVAAAACSSTGDPESEFPPEASSVPAGEEQPEAEQPEAERPEAEQTEAEQQAAPQTPQQALPDTPSEPIVVTVPTGIPELPAELWPTMDDTSPTAEDALKDYLIHHLYEPGWSLGYRIVVGCAGVEASPNVMCAREPRISEEGDRQVYTYSVGPPPPEVSLYSIGIQGSVSEGWWILFADVIAR